MLGNCCLVFFWLHPAAVSRVLVIPRTPAFGLHSVHDAPPAPQPFPQPCAPYTPAAAPLCHPMLHGVLFSMPSSLAESRPGHTFPLFYGKMACRRVAERARKRTPPFPLFCLRSLWSTHFLSTILQAWTGEGPGHCLSAEHICPRQYTRNERLLRPSGTQVRTRLRVTVGSIAMKEPFALLMVCSYCWSMPGYHFHFPRNGNCRRPRSMIVRRVSLL